jgi:hypothetical protein
MLPTIFDKNTTEEWSKQKVLLKQENPQPSSESSPSKSTAQNDILDVLKIMATSEQELCMRVYKMCMSNGKYLQVST